jgi:hypothetical protein
MTPQSIALILLPLFWLAALVIAATVLMWADGIRENW